MPCKERLVFLRERLRAVVFRLSPDVIPNSIELRLAHGESSVSVLPCERGQVREALFDPVRRTPFDKLNRFGQSHAGGNRNENVNVVCHSANFERLHSVLARDAAEKRPEPLANRFDEPGLTVFRAEDEVVI